MYTERQINYNFRDSALWSLSIACLAIDSLHLLKIFQF